MPVAVNRSVLIMVTPTLTWQDANSATAVCTYSQLAANPKMPPAVTPGNGSINLRSMPSNNKFTNQTLITFILDSSQLVDQAGWPISGRWAFDQEGTAPSKGGCFFCEVYPQNGTPNTTPITIPGMQAGRSDPTTPDSNVFVLFNPDGTPKGMPITVQFCLGLVLPGKGNYYITIDPEVKGTGTGVHP